MTQESKWLSDPMAMRALAHPARLSILQWLGLEDSATATEVAEHAGITPSAASYHLRMLAKYGFVQDAPRAATAGNDCGRPPWNGRSASGSCPMTNRRSGPPRSC
ncbi:ArsR/SmtB family transcription factor [Nonomuraea antimicrobica]